MEERDKMQDRHTIEAAYSFFHQKWRVYQYSNNETQKDDIEYAISSYVVSMDKVLFHFLSQGKEGFLQEHTSFEEDITYSIDKMEQILFG